MYEFRIATIFPELLSGFLESSLVGKAREKALIKIDLIDPRGLHDTDGRELDNARQKCHGCHHGNRGQCGQ